MRDQEKISAMAGRRSMVFWTIMFVLSIFIIAEIGDIESELIWLLIVAIVGGAILLYRVSLFQRKTPDLILKRQSLEAYSYGKQTHRAVYIFVFTILAFLFPFTLTGFVGSALWIGSLIGVIDGYVVQLLAYNIYLGEWQKNHKGKLYVVQIWNGSKVDYSGLSFEETNG